MTDFQVWVLIGLGVIAMGMFTIADAIFKLSRNVSEIWKRMERLD